MSEEKKVSLRMDRLLKCRKCKIVRYASCIGLTGKKWTCWNCVEFAISLPSWGGTFQERSFTNTCPIDNMLAMGYYYCLKNPRILKYSAFIVKFYILVT